jgi:hypothetical protein
MKNALVTVLSVVLASAVLFALGASLARNVSAPPPGPDPWLTLSSDGRTLLVSPEVPDDLLLCFSAEPPVCHTISDLRERRN